MEANEEVLPVELKKLLEGPRDFVLLDVRQPWENEKAALPDSVLFPLNRLVTKKPEFPQEQEIITYCHHGMRSKTALELLKRHGFKNVKHLVGGIDLYSQTADPSVPRYVK
jgi:rhodanese-related sulfurtransferase